LPSFPGHDLWKRDFMGASGIFSIVLAVPEKAEHKRKAQAFLNALELFGLGYSWGGFPSLALHVNLFDRRVTPPPSGGPVLRLQIGLEDVADLIEDLERGLSAAKAG
jgi:cystathionine beta-lyase